MNICSLNTVYASSNYIISGKITDSDLRPIKGAKITFEMDGGLNGIQSMTTNYKGNYVSTMSLKSGIYWVTIGKEGYKTYRGKIYLTNDNSYVFDFVLKK
jgi:hypothetical protein